MVSQSTTVKGTVTSVISTGALMDNRGELIPKSSSRNKKHRCPCGAAGPSSVHTPPSHPQCNAHRPLHFPDLRVGHASQTCSSRPITPRSTHRPYSALPPVPPPPRPAGEPLSCSSILHQLRSTAADKNASEIARRGCMQEQKARSMLAAWRGGSVRIAWGIRASIRARQETSGSIFIAAVHSILPFLSELGSVEQGFRGRAE